MSYMTIWISLTWDEKSIFYSILYQKKRITYLSLISLCTSCDRTFFLKQLPCMLCIPVSYFLPQEKGMSFSNIQTDLSSSSTASSHQYLLYIFLIFLFFLLHNWTQHINRKILHHNRTKGSFKNIIYFTILNHKSINKISERKLHKYINKIELE